MSFAPF
jgi:hypothetical protein